MHKIIFNFQYFIVGEKMPIPQNFSDLINIPDGLSFKKGIDISHYQGVISPELWNDIISLGIEFVYLKSTEGTSTIDQLSLINSNSAKQKGLKIGFYHFGRPSGSGNSAIADGELEAYTAFNNLKYLPNPDLPFMLDLEVNALTQQDYLLWINSFINKFVGLNNNNDLIIYSRENFLDANLPPDHGLGQYKLWLSRYNNDYKVASNNIPQGWDDWIIWQFTSTGLINGKNFDLDLMKV